MSETREQRLRKAIAREMADAAGFRPDNEPLEEQYEAADRLIARLRAEFARDEIVATYSLEIITLVMQAAWIEWTHGRGAEAAMTWIDNTLSLPGLIPEDVTDAQAHYDVQHALIEAWRKDADARLASTPAGAP